jgi:ABC-type uncharacterized transport system permease subunit
VLTSQITVAFFVVGLQLMVPLLWVALGEILTEQAGVLNVGVEGVMLLGAFFAAFLGIATGSVYFALLGALGAGVVFGLVLAFLYVKAGTDQIVTGLVFNIFALGLTSVLYSAYLGGKVGPTLGRVGVNVFTAPFADIPLLGAVLTGQNALFFVVLALAAVVWFLLRKTWWGVYARAASERPAALETTGISVIRVRIPAVAAGCVLAALGGAALVLNSSGGFVPGMTSGRGFIALGVVVLARWRPSFAILAASLFGFAQALQFLGARIDALGAIPAPFWLAFPYVVTVVLIGLLPGSRYPSAVGVPFSKSILGRSMAKAHA